MDTKDNKIVVSLSGGMDSTALIGFLLHHGWQVYPISFSYGSKHNKYENKSARDVAAYYGLDLHEIDMESVFSGFDSALLKSGGDIPEGHYASENMKKTVVPGRNLIFISILSGFAASKGISCIGLGVHSGDHAIYPDCRPEFILTAEQTIRLSTDNKVQYILAPFLPKNKSEIIKTALNIEKENGVPVPFDLTRTCYKDQDLSCGKCGSCNERLEAFRDNNILDPIKYVEGGTI